VDRLCITALRPLSLLGPDETCFFSCSKESNRLRNGSRHHRGGENEARDTLGGEEEAER
jgi:hypothetical protein